MPANILPPEKALKRLQLLVRQPTKPDAEVDIAYSLTVPDDLATADVQTLHFPREEYSAMEDVHDALEADLRFEYLESRKREKAVDYFACQCYLNPKKDYVSQFVDQYAQEPTEVTVYMAIEHLVITQPYSFGNIRFLAPNSDELVSLGWRLNETDSSVAATVVKGTNRQKMRERAHKLVEHSLRLLRVTLRQSRSIHDRQLRFRISKGFAFSDGRIGWQEHPETGSSLEISDDLLQLVDSQPVAKLPFMPRNRLERKVNLAIRWLEQAQLATDPLMGVILSMFALEALLGTKSELRKGRGLAFRRALLSSIRIGSFADPNKTYDLYDRVRSFAVHGEEAPEVTSDMHTSLIWDVKRAINEYLEVAAANNFTRASQMIEFLNQHENAPRLLEWLQKRDAEWQEYQLQGGYQPNWSVNI